MDGHGGLQADGLARHRAVLSRRLQRRALIEAEWRSKVHLDFEHAVLKTSLTEVNAKLLLVFEFKRLNTGADARLASLKYAMRGLADG